MKKGVKAIKGKKEVKVGSWESYEVSQWHEATPAGKRNESYVKWELHHLKDGKTPVLVLEKEIGHFRFQSKAIGEKFLITAYVYAPDLKSTSTMEITVIDTEKPKILGIDLSDIQDAKITKPLFAGQTINVHVRTVGMVGHHINITLWEDEKDGTGKKMGTKKITFDKPARVGSKGIAHTQFVIPQDFMAMMKAMTGQGNQQSEYHVTAYDMGILKPNSTTPRVDQEVRKKETKDKVEGKVTPKANTPPFKKNVPVAKPKTPAVPSKPQTPAEAHRDAGKKEITSVFFTDDKGVRIKEADYNSTIRVYITSKNLIGSNFKLTVLDKDNLTNDVLIDAKEYTFTGNTIYIPIPLTASMQRKGGDISYQNLFVDIVVLATSKHLVSVPINVDLKEIKHDPITNVTKFVVEKSEVEKKEKKEDEKNDCPRCKILTADEMTKVFTGASTADKDILRKAFNDANTKFGLDTCQQKAHFFAQVMEEVGSTIKVKDGESLNYRAEDLPIHFSRFRIDPNKKYNKTTNGPNNLAFQYGRIEEIRNGRKVVTQTANQEMIANITYANKEDNGDKDSGDGWKYRGRGIIQITFKRKYTNINRRIKDDYPSFTTIIDADNINSLKEGTIASMAYWEEYKCQPEASKGYSKKELDAIVDIINKDTESRGHRWTNLQSCITIFKVKECKNANPKVIATGDINKYKIEIDKFKYEKVMISSTSKKYQYDIYDSGTLTKTITLDKNEHNLLPFPDTGINWGRFGTRDSGGDNWVDEKVCAALLGFFYSLTKNDYSGTLYFNDISANDGRNIGHSGHRIGNDIDIRYPGSANTAGAVLWSKAAESYTSKEKFVEVLENILNISLKWGFNKNYAYKVGIKNTTGKATSIHQDHFHLGLR